MLLLLVHDDQPDIRAGGEHSRAGPHHDAGLSPPDAFPLVHPFPHGKPAVEHGDAAAVTADEEALRLGGQRDFRDHDQHLTAVRDHPVDQIHIHLRFAGAGHAV